MNSNTLGATSFDQGTSHHHSGKSSMNAAHRSKSSKFTSEAVQEMLSTTPRTLPEIARNPMQQFKNLVGSGSVQSPYVQKQSNHEQAVSLYYSAFVPTPPRSGRKSGSNGGDKSPASATKTGRDGNPLARSSVHPDGDNSSSKPAADPNTPIVPNELTMTYLKTHQKSEDYNRRGYIRSEFQSIQNIHAKYLLFLDVHYAQQEECQEIANQESKQRRTIAEVDEDKSRKKLTILKDHSFRNAKRHEDIRPECPVIEPGRRVYLDPCVEDGCLIELRWRGGVYAGLCALAFDDNGHFIGTASPTETIKGPRNATAIKHYGTSNRSDSPGLGNIGGSTDSFSVIVGNLPVKASKVYLAVFNTAYPGALLNELSRAWLTVRIPVKTEGSSGGGEGGEGVSNGSNSPSEGGISPKANSSKEAAGLSKTTRMKDHYACGVGQAGPYTTLLMASLHKHPNGGAWQFHCHNEPFIWTTSPHRLAPHIGVSLTSSDPFESLETQVMVAYERIAHMQVMSFWEDLSRRVTNAQEVDGWAELTSIWRTWMVARDIQEDRRQVRKAAKRGGGGKQD